MGPFFGDVAQYGIACRNGAQLYFKQLNEKVGVNGEQIDMDVQDEKGDATEAVSVYNNLVQDGVTATVGDVTSTPTIAAAQASVTDNMPCVTAAAITAAGLEAAEKTGEVAGSDAYKQAVIDGIASAKVSSGVTGEISYSGTGDPVKSTLEPLPSRMARRRSSTPSTPGLMEL